MIIITAVIFSFSAQTWIPLVSMACHELAEPPEKWLDYRIFHMVGSLRKEKRETINLAHVKLHCQYGETGESQTNNN